MLPPTRRGGTALWCPGSPGAQPISPGKGWSGTRPPGLKTAGSIVPGSYSQTCSAGWENRSARRPKPGMLAVQPQPEGWKRRIVTFSASPGSAPSTNTGPVTGLTRAKSTCATSAAVLSLVSCPPEASTVSSSMVSPGRTVSAGSIELSQP